jgi:hypothetical protein
MIAYTEFEAIQDPKVERFNEQFPCLFYHDLRPKDTSCQMDDGRTHFTHGKTGETFTWNMFKNTWETCRSIDSGLKVFEQR